MNSNIHIASDEFKECAGKGCQHEGTTVLRIKYLKKNGYFCDFCKAELLQLELAVQQEGKH